MYIRDSKASAFKRAGDGTLLSELIHPDHQGSPRPLPLSIAQAVLRPGAASIPHKLNESIEIYYILAGEGVVTIGEEEGRIREGQTVYIPPSTVQSIKNTGMRDLVFLAIVSPAWQQSDESVLS